MALQDKALRKVQRELEMQRVVRRLRMSVLQAFCTMPSATHLTMLNHMSNLFINSGPSSAAQSDNSDKHDSAIKLNELASTTQKKELAKQTKEGKRLIQLYEI